MLHLPALLTSADLPADERAPQLVTADLLCSEAPRLRRLVHRLLGWQASATDLDDVVQDVLLAAWRHRASFRGDASVATWLCSIALRTARTHARRHTRRQKWLGWSGAEPAARPDAAPDERFDATQRAMQRLDHGDREVLVLRYLEQREIPDIAILLGCSRPAVDARLSRARGKLRAELRLEDRP